MKLLRRFMAPLIIIGTVVLIILLIPRNLVSSGPEGSVRNTGTGGAAALELWLAELGYQAERMEFQEFVLTPNDHALLSITPSEERFSRDESDEALRWVSEDGGTLVFVVDSFNAGDRLLDDLSVEIEIDDAGFGQEPTGYIEGVPQPQQPLAHPPVGQLPRWRSLPLKPQRSDIAQLLTVNNKPVLLAIAEGRGLVYICAYPQLMSNEGLRNPANAALVLNMLSRVPQGGRVLFDEIHHGFQIRQIIAPAGPSPLADLPFWTGLIYAGLVLVLYIILTGRRFGRPVPLREELARRSSSEYVQSMAGLLERGRKTGYALYHYKEQFKRRLARRYGFNPRLQDQEFVRELARFQQVDEQRLGDLLKHMSHQAPDELALLRLVAESDRLAYELETTR